LAIGIDVFCGATTESTTLIDETAHMPLPAINFREIRGHGPLGSRASGFEELSSILVEEALVEWPAGTRFERFADPDGGREGRGVLPSGDVWAWQAKYLFALDASAFAHIRSSTVRALGQEPRLTRYFVMLPYDRPAGDTEAAESAMSKWTRHVGEWRELASEHGLDVSFEYFGEHELAGALTRESQIGRLRYWFDKSSMSQEWFESVVKRAVEVAGPRYTPELHVDLPIARVFDALGRTTSYQARWRSLLADLRSNREFRWTSPENHRGTFEPLIDEAWSDLDQLDSLLLETIDAAVDTSPLPDIEAILRRCDEALAAINAALERHCLRDNYYVGSAAGLYSHARRAGQTVDEIHELRGESHDLLERRFVLLIGDGGTGKTHLLCDVARGRTERSLPTLILAGEQFDGRDPLTQIVELCHFSGTPAELLPALAACAQARGSVALVILDAINEGEAPESWLRNLSALASDVLSHPNLSFVASCRTQLAPSVVSDTERGRASTIIHHGFAETPREALSRYLDGFGLQRPSFPMLEPEFQNPLFLKLLCMTMQRRGETHFPATGLTLDWVFEAFLDTVETVVSSPTRCDFNPGDHLVRRAVEQLAQELLVGDGVLERERVKAVTEALLPDRPWSRSLLKALQDEGIIGAFGRSDRMHFGYQRLGDAAAAVQVARGSIDEVRAQSRAFADEWWRHAGLLEALAVTVPSSHRVELIDLIATEEGVPLQAIRDLLKGLSWRDPSTVTERTVDVVDRSLAHDDLRPEAWAALIRLSTLDGHPLNATLLHEKLLELRLPERDAAWTIFINHADEQDAPIAALLDWAWSGSASEASDGVSRLTLITLGWMFTASNRHVRDAATKAAVNLAESHPSELAAAVREFHGANDPYVIERVLAIACGVALRSSDPTTVAALADAAAELTVRADAWPAHIMARDYARRVLEHAVALGCAPADIDPQNIVPPYAASWPPDTVRSEAEIAALCEQPSDGYSSIWHSLDGYGDFGHYVVAVALEHFGGIDTPQTLSLVRRAIFDRILDLGWSTELFGRYDRHRRWEPTSGEITERIGKKYQWIAFHETLGRLADHHPVGARWRDDSSRAYNDPTDLVYRDIDPTLTARESLHSGWNDTPRTWFAPTPATFSGSFDGVRVADVDGVPDPLELIAVEDDVPTRWVVLQGHPRWSEPQLPEVAALRQPHRRVTMNISSYLLELGKLDATIEWATRQKWRGRWMPESRDVHGLLYADHPFHPSWASVYDAENEPYWWNGSAPPCRLIVPSTFYAGTGTSRDQSTRGVSGFIPSRDLVDVLGLGRGLDFEWIDPTGNVIAQDPGVRIHGNAALVVDRGVMAAALQRTRQTLMWIVQGEKGPYFPAIAGPPDDFVWTDFYAIYVLVDSAVALRHAAAAAYARGPRQVADVAWNPAATG
jgi:hypothetical protein